MNAEQLARDIKSLPEAHKTLDAAGVPNYDSSIGERVAAVVRHKSINSEMNVQAHQELKRAGLGSRGMLPDCAKAVVDELLKLREENKKAISLECSRKTHEHLSRVCDNPWFASLDSRVSILVDELLKLRAQGEVNSSNLSEADRFEIRRRLFDALGMTFDPNMRTLELVDQLIKKHQKLHESFKLLQCFSSGQPKGLAPEKEKWAVAPSQCQGSYSGLFRVMRGNEDATPFPVSEPVAQAICRDLNKQEV